LFSVDFYDGGGSGLKMSGRPVIDWAKEVVNSTNLPTALFEPS
jgi:hypothetical protein